MSLFKKTQKRQEPPATGVFCHVIPQPKPGSIEVKCPKCAQWQFLPMKPTNRRGHIIRPDGVLYPEFVCREIDPRDGMVCRFMGPIFLVDVGELRDRKRRRKPKE